MSKLYGGIENPEKKTSNKTTDKESSTDENNRNL